MKISSDLPEEGKQTFLGGELRYARDGRTKRIYLDEVLASEIEFLHAETMSDQSLWIGIDLKNGTSIHLNIFSVNGKAHIDYRADVFVSDEQKTKDAWLEKDPESLPGLSIRILNVLAMMELRTLGDVCKKKPRDFLRVGNFGKTSLKELQAALGKIGLALREDDS